MASKPWIKKSLDLLNLSGLHPFSQNLWSKIKCCITATILAVLIVELAMDAIFIREGLNFLEPLAALITLQLVMHRFITLIIHRRMFMELLNHTENFASSCHTKHLRNFYTAVQRSYQHFGKTLINYVMGIVMFANALVFLSPVALRTKSVVYPMYHHATNSPYFEILSIVLFLAYASILVFLIAFENVFASFVVDFLCELKTLKEELKTAICVDEGISLKRYELIVDRHNLILRNIKNMNGIYSGLFLNQYLSTAIGLCCSFVTIERGMEPNWALLMAFVITILVGLGQLFLYCLGGTSFSKECEAISMAAYESKWWVKTQPQIRRSLVLIMQRAQTGNMLNAGGIFPMNFETFAKVLKMAYSYYSVVRSFDKK